MRSKLGEGTSFVIKIPTQSLGVEPKEEEKNDTVIFTEDEIG